MTGKRHDIQGLRAWAVIGVVIFHFFPSLLPFGYLGVDVFFVLSGFLISHVLEGKPVLAVFTYTSFYFKRIRRILPLLLLVVLICSIYTIFCYSEALFLYSEKSAMYAALFITNVKDSNEGEDYFRDLEHADDLYTHTWSLSVEIQFYLIAPLLLHVMKPSCSESFHTLGYLFIIAALSFTYGRVYRPFAFYSTLARLWQFMVGAIASTMLKLEKPLPSSSEPLSHNSSEIQNYIKNIPKPWKIVIASALAVVLILWIGLLEGWESAFRCVVTFITGSLLVLKLTTPILSHRSLQIIGDSSYALYLIHWPVVCILRFYEWDFWPIRLLAMFLSFAASFVIYKTFERWYLTLNKKWSVCLIILLYAASILVYGIYYLRNTEAPELLDIDRPRSYREARVLNELMDSQWEKYLKLKDCSPRDVSIDKNPWGFCNLPPGNGNLSFLVIGNSYAANHGRMIIDHLKDHYGRIAVHTVSECEPLIVTKSTYCKDALRLQEEFLNDINTFRPDVLFLIARYIEPNVAIDAQNVKDDSLFKSMMEKLRRYEEKVKKVFILQALPRTANLQKVENAIIREGKSIEGYMEEAIEADSIPMRIRVEEMAKQCKKCVTFDLIQPHMVNGTFMVSNPVTHLHYFEALRHHTVIGLKLVEPVYRQLSDQFNVLMESVSPNNTLS